MHPSSKMLLSFKQYTSYIKLQDGESKKDSEKIMMHLIEKGLTINNYNFGEDKRSFFPIRILSFLISVVFLSLLVIPKRARRWHCYLG
jgi:hypothetical protein